MPLLLLLLLLFIVLLFQTFYVPIFWSSVSFLFFGFFFFFFFQICDVSGLAIIYNRKNHAIQTSMAIILWCILIIFCITTK